MGISSSGIFAHISICKSDLIKSSMTVSNSQNERFILYFLVAIMANWQLKAKTKHGCFRISKDYQIKSSSKLTKSKHDFYSDVYVFFI